MCTLLHPSLFQPYSFSFTLVLHIFLLRWLLKSCSAISVFILYFYVSLTLECYCSILERGLPLPNDRRIRLLVAGKRCFPAFECFQCLSGLCTFLVILNRQTDKQTHYPRTTLLSRVYILPFPLSTGWFNLRKNYFPTTSPSTTPPTICRMENHNKFTPVSVFHLFF